MFVLSRTRDRAVASSLSIRPLVFRQVLQAQQADPQLADILQMLDVELDEDSEASVLRWCRPACAGDVVVPFGARRRHFYLREGPNGFILRVESPSTVYTSPSPSAQHLRACPVREVVTVTWDPHPREPVEGVLRATSALELAATMRTLELSGKRWLGQWRVSHLQSSRGWSGTPRTDETSQQRRGACRVEEMGRSVRGDRENRVLSVGRGTGSRVVTVGLKPKAAPPAFVLRWCRPARAGDVFVSFGARRKRPFLREGPNGFVLRVECENSMLEVELLPLPGTPILGSLSREYSGLRVCSKLSWLDWDAEVSFRSSSRCSPASPFLTASLFAAPEPLREARRGTVVRPDYGRRAPGRGDGAVGKVPIARSGSLFSVYVTLGPDVQLNTGVRVSRSDDTDLDGTTQVPGQSPELTAWLTKNLGHLTGEVGVNPYAANSNRHPQRPHPMPPSSCSQRPLTWTPTGQRPPLAANSN
ncbi:hypothetical protein Taro_045403 [Colocasia esculenta]|uniref:Uncharacterized protein n=1 Tax=Colocasia esculenta TaxID=4460 RepID=A0A843WWY9_COLES|nr:hypothetical protein [Colocasia esculenta]